MTISRFERYSQSRERALKLCFPGGRPCVHVIAVSRAGARRLYCFRRCNAGCSPRARKPGPSTRRPLRATERDTAPRRAKSVPVARCAADAGARWPGAACAACAESTASRAAVVGAGERDLATAGRHIARGVALPQYVFAHRLRASIRIRATVAAHVRTATNCIPAFRARLCLCRRRPAAYAHDKRRHDSCADVPAHTPPIGDAVPLTSYKPKNRS